MLRGAQHGLLRISTLAPFLADRFLTHYVIGTHLFLFTLKLFQGNMHS